MIEIFNLIDKFWISFTIVAIIIYFWVSFTKFYLEKYKRDNRLDKLNLKNHDIFSKINNLINVETKYIDATYESKKNMAKDYIKLSMFVFLEELKKLLNDINDNYDEELLYNKLLDFTTEQDKKIYKINHSLNIDKRFIEKYEYYNKQRNDLIKNFISRIIKSDYYTTKIKIAIILDNYIKEWEWSIYDVKNAIRDINWELKAVEYKEQLEDIETIKKFYYS